MRAVRRVLLGEDRGHVLGDGVADDLLRAEGPEQGGGPLVKAFPGPAWPGKAAWPR
jgi:hypothetical protein